MKRGLFLHASSGYIRVVMVVVVISVSGVSASRKT